MGGYLSSQEPQEHNVNLYCLSLCYIFTIPPFRGLIVLLCFDRTELLALTAEIMFINDTTLSPELAPGPSEAWLEYRTRVMVVSMCLGCPL